MLCLANLEITKELAEIDRGTQVKRKEANLPKLDELEELGMACMFLSS